MFRSLAVACALIGAVALSGSAFGKGPGWPQPDARDKALLASVLRGMKTDLTAVRLTQMEGEWRRGRRPRTLELMTTASVSRKDIVRSTKADWDSLLIAHAYNERCLRHADHCIAVDGAPNFGGPAGRSGAHRPYWGAHRLARAIRSRFAAAGLRVTSIAFEHPNARAPIITVRSSHLARAYMAERKAWLALLPALRHTEGSFVKMLGPRGHLIYVGAGSGNTGEGWCAPVLKCPGTGAVAGP